MEGTLTYRRIRSWWKRTWEAPTPNLQASTKGSMELLRVTGLHAFYGEAHILHGIDFKVGRGEGVILLGRTGAGRTTTLKASLGIVGPRYGSVSIDSREQMS